MKASDIAKLVGETENLNVKILDTSKIESKSKQTTQDGKVSVVMFLNIEKGALKVEGLDNTELNLQSVLHILGENMLIFSQNMFISYSMSLPDIGEISNMTTEIAEDMENQMMDTFRVTGYKKFSEISENEAFKGIYQLYKDCKADPPITEDQIEGVESFLSQCFTKTLLELSLPLIVNSFRMFGEEITPE